MTNTTIYLRKALNLILELIPQRGIYLPPVPPDPAVHILYTPDVKQTYQLPFRPSETEPRVVTAARQYRAVSLHNRFLHKMHEILENHLQDTAFHVEKLSREMGMSRVHLYRKLKEVNGYSPSAYIRNFRLQKAARILSTEFCSVSDVAYRTGFNDLSHFSKCFKKLYGICPSAYQGMPEVRQETDKKLVQV